VLSLLDETRGSDLVLLPELWPCGFFSFARYEAESEPVEGPTVQALRRKARELRTHLFTGSFVEREGTSLYNTAVLLGPGGELLARYRKIHLFGYQSEERRLLRRGEEVVVVPTPWGKAGLSICYDLRFPELYRKMIDQGADFFLVASAWPHPRLEPWVLLNRARALESLAYLFSCNCTGSQADRRYAGHSLFVDPLGKVIAEAGDAEAILAAEVDPGLVAAVRADFPALRDRVFR
jgi:predicted amidohydrolase